MKEIEKTQEEVIKDGIEVRKEKIKKLQDEIDDLHIALIELNSMSILM